MNKANGKYIFECINCGKQYAEDQAKYLCPVCNAKNQNDKPPLGVLKVVYDYDLLKGKKTDFSVLKSTGFLSLLPIDNPGSLPCLRVGNTPLYNPETGLFFKDDSQNPTFSFKDRASALVSAFAKEKGWNTIVAASTGNAGSSIAGICAAQGQKAIVLVPENAPMAKLTQIMMYGAGIIPVRGTYDDAFDLSIRASEAFGWYNRNTAYNPFTIEGKKTVSFELYEQMGFRVPQRIFVSVGDGVIISGVYKGFEDLLKLGFIDEMPEVIAVQAQNSDNLIRNLDSENFIIKPSNTIADSISVDIPRNFYMTRQFIRKYSGKAILVSDAQILEASSLLSKKYGLFAEPAAIAAYAGYLIYQEKFTNKDRQSTSVVLLTGSGLKDTAAVKSILKMPESIKPDLDKLKKILS
ncbi:MAG: pyridoxal-phosphate dependent enzyme [Bacteroidales bacterium]|nr:pyridoxal-phosphate dependent enzyme [Bacteroidales bacterium]